MKSLLLTPARRIEAARIVLVGLITLLFWRDLLPLPALIACVAIVQYLIVASEPDAIMWGLVLEVL